MYIVKPKNLFFCYAPLRFLALKLFHFQLPVKGSVC